MVRKKLIFILIILYSFSVVGQISIVPVRGMVEIISVEDAHEMITNSTLYPVILVSKITFI